MVHCAKSRGVRELALFAGAGGGCLGGKLLGWRTVCAVEIEKYPRDVLLQRQRDGIFDPFPIWDDVRTFDGKPWCGKVDVISGGFPCQDISCAGKGLGVGKGTRSGLWREYARIIREVRPRYCFVENSPMLTVRGLGLVLGDLAAIGYDASWKVLSAEECGAPHERQRMWIVAKDSRRNDFLSYPDLCGFERGEQFVESAEEEDSSERNIDERGKSRSDREMQGGAWWKSQPGVVRVANGVAFGMERIKAIGNGQVPIVAATAFCELVYALEKRIV